jgi:hypothetical protein
MGLGGELSLFIYPPRVKLDHPCWLYQEVLRLRDLLRLVAGELERLSATEGDPQRRAMRIRERLDEAWPGE